MRITVVTLGLAATLFVLIWTLSREQPATALNEEAHAQSRIGGVAVEAAAAGGRRTVVEDQAADDPREGLVPLTDLGLIRQALRVARATRTNDGMRISEATIPLIYEHGNLLRAMEIVRAGRLPDVVAAYCRAQPAEVRPGLATTVWDAEIGVAFSVFYAVVKHNNAYTPPVLFQGAPVDGFSFTVEALRLIPSFGETARERLLTLLASAVSDDGEAWVGPAYFRAVLALREAAPEHAEVYAVLLEKMGLSMNMEQALMELSPMLEDPTDPGFASALRGLLAHEPLRGLAVAAAREGFDSAPDSTRRLLALTIASHSEPQDAVDFLTDRDDPLLLGAFRKIGAREGGQEALFVKYQDLLQADVDPDARALLLGGMTDGDEIRTLDYVLATDPSAAVRTTAVMSLVRAQGDQVSPSAMEALERGLRGFRNPQEGLEPHGAVACLGNILTTSRDEQTRGRATRLLIEVAGGAEYEGPVRRGALENLKRHASIGSVEIEALRASLP